MQTDCNAVMEIPTRAELREVLSLAGEDPSVLDAATKEDNRRAKWETERDCDDDYAKLLGISTSDYYGSSHYQPQDDEEVKSTATIRAPAAYVMAFSILFLLVAAL